MTKAKKNIGELKSTEFVAINSQDITREDILKDKILREHYIWRMDANETMLENFIECIDSAKYEKDIQKFIENNPIIISTILMGSHGRWVIPQKKLGSEFVTDFILGCKHSGGYEWFAVELENPKYNMFTKASNPSSYLNHAIRQIQDWRAWLQRNQNYASRPIEENGLGLKDINSNIPGYIFIGRRKNYDEKNNDLRRQMKIDSNISIHTYDYIIEKAKQELAFWPKHK